MEYLINSPHVKSLMDLAYQEDLAHGDVTSDLLFADKHTSEAEVETRQHLVLAGLPLAAAFFKKVDPFVITEFHARDTREVQAGTAILTLRGATKSILKAERTALNFLQYLSGIATLTHHFVSAARATHPGVRIVDTRKTAPGYRYLAKYAVKCGGGHNHRFTLSDAAMIKDNHIAAAGSIAKAVARLRAEVPHTTKIEVEADTPEQARAAAQAGAEIILLDNMPPDAIRALVEELGEQVILEASGGINLANVAEYAATGVHVISIGAITHSAPAADLSLNFK
jgi:nicotinate-nucleotide pyrophosphorylase (carboxylating)